LFNGASQKKKAKTVAKENPPKLANNRYFSGQTQEQALVEELESEDENETKETTKKTSKSVNEETAVLYIGHIPHGFFEKEMRGFFSQFGKILGLILKRSYKTGGSKGYGFLKFESVAIAKVVRETMNKYYLAHKFLDVKSVPSDRVNAIQWEQFNTELEAKSRAMETRNKRSLQGKTKEEISKMQEGLLRNDDLRRKKLKSLGVNYEFPGYGKGKPESQDDTIEKPVEEEKKTSKKRKVSEEKQSKK